MIINIKLGLVLDHILLLIEISLLSEYFHKVTLCSAPQYNSLILPVLLILYLSCTRGPLIHFKQKND